MNKSKRLFNIFFGLRQNTLPEDSEDLRSMYKKLMIISWPAALEGLLLSLMNSFDTMMVGKLGDNAISSVGLCAQPRMILLMLAQALCVGTTAVIARRKGENNRDGAISCMKQSLIIITLIGIIITVGGYFLGPPLLLLAGADAETLPDAVDYFRVISLALIPNCWSLCICASMRGIGKTRITLLVNIISNIVNVFFNYCFILGHLGFPALGVKGAAIATAIGTCASSMIAIFVAMKKKEYLTLRPLLSNIGFDKQTINGIVKVGSGTIVDAVFMRIGFLLNGKLIAGVSNAAYATSQIVQQVTSLTFTLGDGVASACTSLVGQSLGAKMPEKAKTYSKLGMRISLYMSIILIIFIFFAKDFLPTLFTESPNVIHASSLCFFVVIFGTYFQNKRVVNAGCLKGAGDTRYLALVSLISVCIMRPLLTWFFSYPMAKALPNMMLGYIGAWLSFDIDCIIRSFLIKRRLNMGEWVKIKL